MSQPDMGEQQGQLHHYLDLWQLTDPKPLTQTFSSYLYTVIFRNERVVLKLLKPAGWEEKTGAAALRHFDGQGAVRLLDEADGAYLLEYASGENLVPFTHSGNDAQATAIIGEVLNQLHNAPPPPLTSTLDPLKRWFRELFNQAEKDRNSGLNSILVRAAAVAETVLDDPQDVRVLHGDIHHENIRYHPQRGWLAFDPKGLVGERTYDTANTFCNPMNMPELTENMDRILQTAEILAAKTKMHPKRILTFVFMYSALSASWFISDGQHPAHEIRIAELVEPHILR
ncbi:MAG TPA: aminoglycoside phosphotransferase family protein [Phototrophicaceae bacterium]|jgi:streptomycin 6-kinase|nr:aminoglycoside phosphotransferase family protein [Phototrophicaceae bacterium]